VYRIGIKNEKESIQKKKFLYFSKKNKKKPKIGYKYTQKAKKIKFKKKLYPAGLLKGMDKQKTKHVKF